MAEIVFLSHTPVSSPFRVGSHHLSRELAAMGHDVAHVSTPYSRVHQLTRRAQRARAQEARRGVHTVDGVRHLVPTPTLPANLRWSPRQMSDALERVELRSPDFVFVDQPLLDPSAIRDTTIIFRPTDLFPPGQAEDRARKLAATSAGLAATSPGVMAAYGGFCRGPKLVLENGVEFPRFRSVVDTNPSKEYDFVYVGALDERFDFESLAEAARRNPTASFVLFGPIPSARPNLPDNVDLRGTIGYDDVPLVMSRGRWGMMPFLQSDLNTSRSPMKLYEYVAAGLPVVAPAATLSRAGSLRGGHAFDGATSSFANVVSDLLRRNEDGFDERDLRVAAAVDWRSVANRLLDFASDVRNAL